MTTKTEAIKNFLTDFTHADLAGLYNYSMEVQVNVAQDAGERIQGEGWQGRMWHGYTDGEQTWKAIRIPWNAKAKPEFRDSKMVYDLAHHAEAIGMTGWDWEHQISKWVAFDFDGISGHSEGHVAKLTDQELLEVQKAACELPWVTVRKSSGGQGLHLYVFLDIPTKNHTEHAALGRSILGKMSADTGFDFTIKVDACGGNMWVWHRKIKNTDGLTLVKSGNTFTEIPVNWRDHLDVIRKKRRRSYPNQIKSTELSAFEELTGQRPRTKLDASHKKLLDFLKQSKASWWFDQDHWMLVCHTYDLKKAHEELNFRGVFDTLATGKDKGVDWNAYCFPMGDPIGSWNVRRYTPGVAEAACWEQDANGWTQCYYNRDPSLRVASRAYDGIEDEKGDYHFNEAETAASAARMLGADLKLPPWACCRQTVIKQHKDGRLVVHVKREPSDNYSNMVGWREDKGWWKRLFNARLTQSDEVGSVNFDSMLRHVSTIDGQDLGWVVKAHDTWHTEPLQHIRVALKAHDLGDKEINKALGACVIDPWTEVNEPFQDEYPGGRRWNRGCAQFRYIPQEHEPFKHPTWDCVLKHCGLGLDSTVKNTGWCQTNGVDTGEDYLRIWIASLFQYPKRPLPYLFLYSKAENTGKSTLHEALSFLINNTGYARADAALISAQGFNGELVNAVLCVVQETDISKSVGARNRLKDWVTALQFPVHIKNRTPYLIPNTTHYIHTANDYRECPIFPGDSRITVINVPLLEPFEMIPRDELHNRLKREAPAFMGSILKVEIPRTPDRLNVPIIETQEKLQSARLNRTDFEIFLEETVHFAPGQMILYSELWARFQEWLAPEDVHLWSKIRMGRELPIEYPKGRIMAQSGKFYIGNIAYEKPASITADPKLVLVGDALVKEDE